MTRAARSMSLAEAITTPAEQILHQMKAVSAQLRSHRADDPRETRDDDN